MMPPTQQPFASPHLVPTQNLYPPKVWQQGVLALHSVRSLLVKQQTMLANAIRGLLTEFGMTAPKGIGKIGELMTLVATDEAIPERARRAVKELYDKCDSLDGSWHQQSSPLATPPKPA